MCAIEQEKCMQIQKQILEEIESFKRTKLLSSINIIRRIEIEQWIEIVATSLSLEYKKELNPTNTVYYLYINDTPSQLKVFFRYGTFYTRHQIID